MTTSHQPSGDVTAGAPGTSTPGTSTPTTGSAEIGMERSGTAEAGTAELGYEQARDELVEIVRRLEAGAATLEESLRLWERGEALAVRCEQWLAGAKARVEAATSPTSPTNPTGPTGPATDRRDSPRG